MANNISDFLELELLDHSLGTASYTMPTVYIALFDETASEAQLEAGTLTGESSGGSYARETAAFDVAASGATANSSDIEFTQATANWGTVTYVAIMDAASAGNVLWFGTLATAKAVNDGDTFKIPAGDLDVSLN